MAVVDVVAVAEEPTLVPVLEAAEAAEAAPVPPVGAKKRAGSSWTQALAAGEVPAAVPGALAAAAVFAAVYT